MGEPINWTSVINFDDLGQHHIDLDIDSYLNPNSSAKFQYGTRTCERDYNCGKNMECLNNICYCIPGFFPENDYCVGKPVTQAGLLLSR